MNADDRIRLQHMLDAAHFALRYLPAGKDSLTEEGLRALLYSIQVIGAAASSVTEEFRTLTPQIPWHKVRGMRNRLVHRYFDVDVDVVWNALNNNIHQLAVELEELLKLP